MNEPTPTITVDGKPYTEQELAELLGLDSLENLDPEGLALLIEQANQDASRQLSELIAATAILSAVLLLRTRTPGVRYFVPREQYYRGRSAIPNERIRSVIADEELRNSRRTTRHATDLIAGRIGLREYHSRMTRDIVSGHLRMMQLGAGGADRLTPEHYARLREQLYGHGPGRGDLNRLQRHVERISEGLLTEGQIRDRSRRYGANVGPSYEDSRHINLVQSPQQWEARRFLDPSARHCPDCPGLQVVDWSPVEDVTPVGLDCRCQSRCKCRVEIRLVKAGFNTANFSQTIVR